MEKNVKNRPIRFVFYKICLFGGIMMEMEKKGCRNLIFAMITLGLVALIAGCQTMIPVSYTEPARVNMSGISKIGLITNDSSAGKMVSAALTSTGKYTVVPGESEINRYKAWQDLRDYYDNAIEVKAADLVSAYSSNAIRANSTYEEETLIVHGTISDFQENAIRLGVGNDSVDVYILPSEREKAASLEKGANVTIIGECYGLKAPDLKDTGEILRILGGGQHVNIARASFYAPPGEYTSSIDAFLYLNTSSSDKVESKKEKRAKKNSEGKTVVDADGNIIYIEVPLYRRVVDVTASYQIENLSGKVIGKGKQSESKSTSYNENRGDLPEVATLVDSLKKKILPNFISDMVPTERTINVVLEKSDSKNKEVTGAMRDAKKLVDAKNYAAAANAYGKIYAETKDFAAGYNQAILTEVAKNTDEAIVLMQALAVSSKNTKAQNMLKEMNSRSAKNKQSAEQVK